ncbi:MAG: hypothetical protein JXA78_04110 [Anaerolineales bacterium]|nr:hypothetical protein [Anaerolineales bacterium]
MVTTKKKMIPIYTSRGDMAAFLLYPYIYNTIGDWIGWVAPDRSVYSVHGHFVGTLSKDPRILRKREWSSATKPPMKPPPAPPPIRPPVNIPLAPPMAEVAGNMIDVLDEAPELMPSIDFGELRDDME